MIMINVISLLIVSCGIVDSNTKYHEVHIFMQSIINCYMKVKNIYYFIYSSIKSSGVLNLSPLYTSISPPHTLN